MGICWGGEPLRYLRGALEGYNPVALQSDATDNYCPNTGRVFEVKNSFHRLLSLFVCKDSQCLAMPMYGDHGLKLVCLHFQYSVWMRRVTAISNKQSQVVQAKRAQNLAHLPPYETELVRETAREVRDLDRDVNNILEPFQGSFDPNANQGVAGTLLTNHLSMRRNKRCLLAYHRTRTNKLEELVWRGADVVDLSGQQVRDGAAGGNAPGGRSTDSGTSSLSPQEEDYVRQYGDLLAAYKGQWTDIDLTGSLEPPRDLFIDVRVLKDAGEIQTEYGYVNAQSRTCSCWTCADISHHSAITLTKNSQFYVRQGDVERLIAQGYLQKLS